MESVAYNFTLEYILGPLHCYNIVRCNFLVNFLVSEIHNCIGRMELFCPYNLTAFLFQHPQFFDELICFTVGTSYLDTLGINNFVQNVFGINLAFDLGLFSL